MDDLAFTYDELTHIYRNAAGVERPSVTQTLMAQQLIDYSMVPPDVLERARVRGKNVHRWCAEYDLHGFCDETWMTPEERDRYDAWVNFVGETKLQIIHVERPMLGLIAGVEVGGTPDVIGRFRSSRLEWIIDRKCCAASHPAWALQLADYEMLRTGRTRCGTMGRMSVRLLPGGRYSVQTYADPRDAYAAIAAVELTDWDDQAQHANADHARATLDAWKANHHLSAA